MDQEPSLLLRHAGHPFRPLNLEVPLGIELLIRGPGAIELAVVVIGVHLKDKTPMLEVRLTGDCPGLFANAA